MYTITPKCIAVANYLIEKTNAYNTDKDFRNKIIMSSQRLQKLLYFSNIEYMFYFNKPLVQDLFFAWPNGPAIPFVYTRYVQYQSGEMRPIGTMHEPLSYEERAVLDKIFNVTINITTATLVNISKVSNGPWHNVYNELDPEHKQMILNDEMLNFYNKGAIRYFFDDKTQNEVNYFRDTSKSKGLISMDLEIKDALYYSDLIYELRSLAGFEQQEDKTTEERIAKRKEDIFVKHENETFTLTGFKLSVFQEELFYFVSRISIKANVNFNEPEEISRYPELVNEVLVDLENKKKELNNTDSLENNGPVLTKKLTPSNK